MTETETRWNVEHQTHIHMTDRPRRFRYNQHRRYESFKSYNDGES